jgi:hypothetical protein
MKQISHNNTSFDYLRGSSDFLNQVINNISSCVLLLDKEMKLVAFNDSMKSIFSNRKNENLLYVKCGNALGCAFAVEEMKDCGSTTRCAKCDIRIAAMISYIEKKEVYREHVIREFYTFELTKVAKHLQFSTRFFQFEKESYIIMIVDDISKHMELCNQVKKQEEEIKLLTSLDK